MRFSRSAISVRNNLFVRNLAPEQEAVGVLAERAGLRVDPDNAAVEKLVMWLVTAVSKEQRAAIFDYFKNPSMERGAPMVHGILNEEKILRAKYFCSSPAARKRRSIAPCASIIFSSVSPPAPWPCSSVARWWAASATGDSPEQDRPVKLTTKVRLHSRARDLDS